MKKSIDWPNERSVIEFHSTFRSNTEIFNWRDPIPRLKMPPKRPMRPPNLAATLSWPTDWPRASPSETRNPTPNTWRITWRGSKPNWLKTTPSSILIRSKPTWTKSWRNLSADSRISNSSLVCQFGAVELNYHD